MTVILDCPVEDFKSLRWLEYGIKTRAIQGLMVIRVWAMTLNHELLACDITGIKCIVTLFLMVSKQWVVVSIPGREVWRVGPGELIVGCSSLWRCGGWGRAGLLRGRGSLSWFLGHHSNIPCPFWTRWTSPILHKAVKFLQAPFCLKCTMTPGPLRCLQNIWILKTIFLII